MTDWLVDTFIFTGVLIALVLVIRRPVAKHFGAQLAYALWALPLLRFLLPPVVLPANLAPEQPPATEEPLVIVLSEATANASDLAMAPPPVAPISIELFDLLLPFWLGGAAIFLALRTRDYLRMRRDLLEEARPVGEAGKVRLVETPAVSSPVAFGVSDKVVALPSGFMAHHDIAARDMAIAHELAHHRGHDLVANIAAQPLLALHWFNPLAWWGWRAMRRDQEAACDARVVAGRERSERAAYAQVIAGFAAGPNLALAAPMACPVLGEKSIIHRLRSLTMTEIPSGRKKLGIAAIVTTALVALPVTASISYAQEDAPEAPAAPMPPEAPAAPAPPAPPRIESIDPDDDHRIVRVHVEHDGEEGDHRRRMIIRRFGPDGEFGVEEREFPSDEEMERMFSELEVEMRELEGLDEHIELALVEAHRAMDEAQHNVVILRREHQAAAGSQEHGEEARARAERARVMAMEHAQHAREMALRNMPRIEFACDEDEVVQNRELEDGSRVMVICRSAANNMALRAVRQARRAIPVSPGLSEEQRERIIEELESEIQRMEEEIQRLEEQGEEDEVSFAPAPSVKLPASNNVQPAATAPRMIRTSAVRFGIPEEAGKSAKEDCDEQSVGTLTV